MITAFKNIYSKEPHYITLEYALERILKGHSGTLVKEIRESLDKNKSAKLKANLPSICFSGKFGANRTDAELIEHSGLIVLDFDNVGNLREKQIDIMSNKFVYACWVSPSGNGLKALIKIADGSKHREHFQALQDVFPEIDKSGINPSRVCYESYDPDLYKNEKAAVFTKTKKIEKIKVVEKTDDDVKIFRNILQWLSNKNEAFVTGERNNFIFKLASACCRFGVHEETALYLINNEFTSNSEFTKSEADRAIRSGYRKNASGFGSASFDKELLVDKVTHREVKVEEAVFDNGLQLKDVIYGIDVKEQAMALYDSGYRQVDGIDVPELDEKFKPKRGEITALSGIGNYGKSSFKRWYHVMRILKYGEKFATFSPEDNPPEEYYHDMTEIMLGCDCSPSNPHRPSRQVYEAAYDLVCKHVFYVYPKDVSPTPQYVMEVFLRLIVNEGVDGVDIDPFNQLTNEYNKFPRADKYLEWVLSTFGRFAQMNDVFFWIILHPTKMSKASDGNYPCPDVFDLTDGAMWNNKMDNILIYHRPFAQTDPQNPTCEFYSKKIRRQKIVGKKGFIVFEMVFSKRRFFFDGADPLQKLLNDKNMLQRNNKPSQISFEKNWTPFDEGDIDQPF